jgi:glycerophosphoryl diester phosphodiesterase
MTHDLKWLVARPIAHRGLHDASKAIIENTASAFSAAISHSYTIECDLQLAADGEAMVFHDDTLDRLTTQQGALIEFTARDLHEVPFKLGKHRMQTFAQLLQQVDGQVPLVIELKSHWNGNDALARRALEVLKDYKGHHALMSFDPDLVAAVATRSPETLRGITADGVTDPEYDMLPEARRLELKTMSHLPRTRPHFVSFAYIDLPHAPVSALRAQGHPIISWTIKSPAQEEVALRHSDQVTFEGYLA